MAAFHLDAYQAALDAMTGVRSVPARFLAEMELRVPADHAGDVFPRLKWWYPSHNRGGLAADYLGGMPVAVQTLRKTNFA